MTRTDVGTDAAPTRSAGPATGVAGRAALLGGAATLLGAAGAWVPSAWSDEAATLSAAGRPWGELGLLLRDTDAVHGLYYALVHLWSVPTGGGLLAVRLLSALAVGLAVAGVVVLGARVASPTAGTVAGVVLAVLPRTTWAATEARSSALALAAAVWLTVLLVVAVRRDRRVLWAAYAVAVLLGTVLWLLLALLPLAHVLTLWAWRTPGGVRLRHAAAAAGGLALAVPFVLVATGQSGQVAWIPGPSGRTLRQLAVDQAFGTAGVAGLPLVLLAWALVAVAVVVAVRGPGPVRALVALGLPWLVLPPVLTVAWSAVGEPLYVPKYLTWTAPGLALVVTAGVLAVARRPATRVALVALLALLAVPGYVEERRADAKDGSDWAAVARVVRDGARPGDAVVWSDLMNAAGLVRAPAHAIAVAYPDAFAGLLDPTRVPSGGPDGTLWDGTRALADAPALADAARVWWVHDPASPRAAEQRAELAALGFRVVPDVGRTGGATDVVLLDRG